MGHVTGIFARDDREQAGIATLTCTNLWENPEVALQETEFSELLQAALREEGFDVETGIGSIETAFIALYVLDVSNSVGDWMVIFSWFTAAYYIKLYGRSIFPVYTDQFTQI